MDEFIEENDLGQEVVALFQNDSQPERCKLSESDLECGKIYFDELTRILKYACYFCESAYDDINFYCGHLSDHINGTPDADLSKSEKETCETFDDIQLSRVETDLVCPMDNISDNGINPSDGYLRMDFASTEFSNTLGIESENERNMESFNRIVIDKPQTEGATCNLPNSKNRKVTTVKIINSKNRITELYKQIKLEEEKNALGITSKYNDWLLSDERLNDIEETHVTNEASTKHSSIDANFAKGSTQPLVRQIGETLITILPPSNESETPKHSCPACGKCFRNVLSLASHKRTHYLESRNSIKLAHKCCDCEELFNNLSDLREHVKKEHFPNGFVCKICNRKFSKMALLERHMRSIHLAKPYFCQICSKALPTFESFEAHRQCYHPENCIDQILKCRICGRKYKTEGLLQQHMRNHKEKILLTCIVCGKETLRLKQHMRTHNTPQAKLPHHTVPSIVSELYRRKEYDDEEIDIQIADLMGVGVDDLQEQRVVVEIISSQPPKATLEDVDLFAHTNFEVLPQTREDTISAVHSIIGD